MLETDEMTIIWCGNLAAISGELCSFISSFDSPANANAAGLRQYVSANGTGNLSAANGAGNSTSISSTFTGAWTAQTMRLGQAAIQRLTLGAPAQDYIEQNLSLDELCISHRAATFFMCAGESSVIKILA